MDSSGLVSAVLGSLVLLAGSLLAWSTNRAIRKSEERQKERDREAIERQKAREAELTERTVDGEQFDRITRELNRRIDRFKDDMEEERKARERAEERAGRAEDRAQQATTRVDDLEHKFDASIDFIRLLLDTWGQQHYPPDPPGELIPPLSLIKRDR